MLITVSGLAEDTSVTVMSVSVSNSVLSVCVCVCRGLRVAAHEGLVQLIHACLCFMTNHD